MRKIEEAARRICLDQGFNPDDIMSNDGPRWGYYKPLIISVLSVIREPNKEMLKAFDQLVDDNGQCLVKTGFTAMIDSILKE